MPLYAAYGSNLHPVRLQERVKSASVRGTAVLEDWKLAFSKRSKDGSGKATLVELDGAQAHVAVYDVSPR